MRYEYDENKVYIKTVLDTDLKNTTDVRPQDGLYKAIWNGSEWIEGATQEYIDSLNVVVKEPTLADRIADVETALAEMLGGVN